MQKLVCGRQKRSKMSKLQPGHIFTDYFFHNLAMENGWIERDYSLTPPSGLWSAWQKQVAESELDPKELYAKLAQEYWEANPLSKSPGKLPSGTKLKLRLIMC